MRCQLAAALSGAVVHSQILGSLSVKEHAEKQKSFSCRINKTNEQTNLRLPCEVPMNKRRHFRGENLQWVLKLVEVLHVLMQKTRGKKTHKISQ